MPTAKTKPQPQPGANSPVAHEVLTLAEAAAWLRLTEPVVERLARAGSLPGRFAEGEWRFLRAALCDWLAGSDFAPKPLSSKERMLAVAGALAADETLPALVEDIYRDRKKRVVGDEA
jgi:hypothetical protein